MSKTHISNTQKHDDSMEMNTKSHFANVCLAITALASVAVAAYLFGQSTSQPRVMFSPIEATAAETSERFSMATGPVSDDAEGLFLLDHNSGLLQCNVIYPRAGRFMASFSAQVGEALGAGGKGGQYLMMTGLAEFRQSSATPAAPSVVYVLDTATGNYACYGIPFNRVLVNSNRPQQGVMQLIATGTANPVITRDPSR
ncbi:hypothetical protein Q31b_40230 [Novipirellula aureliae]|uniref:Uncharacterized protein n=1 Tax=Novipirellula aureliae TaxID=2527966 RepID=A0A5C6DRU3_9BACT|nr:hypothetical protein [Novipirellula aureliae]TWU38945.1 hypothetical protein Q31b_40230 [Novipirellula aureliae]